MNKEILQEAYKEFQFNKSDYDKMYEYYIGNTDAIKEYKFLTKRSNLKVNVNFIKKFIKEEVSYSVGNDINYISKSGNEDIVNDIDYYLDHWEEGHDANLAKNMLIYGLAYELYYFDRNGDFSSKIIPPTMGFHIENQFGYIEYFAHVYELEDEILIDIYDNEGIYTSDENFINVQRKGNHRFRQVPVGICKVSDEGKDDTLYKDLKGLQDAYETNLSDISNEISDFRNAYLTVFGAQFDEDEDIEKMKEKGVMEINNPQAKIEWLIKNINDTFIQNTLSTLEDKMYQVSSHINHNEKMQSNLSSLTLRSRLISLEEKCKLNQKSLADCIKERLKFLFEYLKLTKNKEYDFRDIKIKFTPNIPQDDLMTAQIINQLGDKLSTETGLSLLSFIENPKNELDKINKESEELLIGEELLESGIDE